MPMRAPKVDDYLVRLAEFGVEVEEFELPRVGRSPVPVLTLIRKTREGRRLMVPLGDLSRNDVVSPQLVDSWCDQLQIQKLAYASPEDY